MQILIHGVQMLSGDLLPLMSVSFIRSQCVWCIVGSLLSAGQRGMWQDAKRTNSQECLLSTLKAGWSGKAHVGHVVDDVFVKVLLKKRLL